MFLSKTIYFILTALTGLGAGSLLIWFLRNKTAISMKVRVLGALLVGAVAVAPLLAYKTSVTILTKDDVANYELLGETDFDLSNGKKIHIPNMGHGDFIINNSADSFAIERFEYDYRKPKENPDDLVNILILIKPMSAMAFHGSSIHYFFKEEPEHIRMYPTDAAITKFQLRYFQSKDWDEYYIYDGEIKYGKPDGKGTLWSDKFTYDSGNFVEGKLKRPEYKDESKGTCKEALKLIGNGKINEGIKIVNYLISHKKDSLAYFYTLKGRALYKLEEFELAKIQHRLAIEADDSDYGSYASLGDAFQKTNQPDSALFYYAIAMTGLGDDPIVLNNMGSVYCEKEEYETAAEIFKHLVADYPDSVDYIYNLSFAYYKTQKSAEALLFINKALKAEPSDHELYNLKGSIFILQGNKKEAKKMWEKSLQIQPDTINTAHKNLKSLNL